MRSLFACIVFAIIAAPALSQQEVALQQRVSSLSDTADERTAGYFYRRGLAARDRKEYDLAWSWYDRGITKFPQHCLLSSLRAALYLDVGQYHEAEMVATRALELREHLAADLAADFRQGNEEVDTSSPGFKNRVIAGLADLYMLRAKARLYVGNYAGAQVDIDEAITMSPTDDPDKKRYCKMKGDCYMTKSNNKNALTWYDKALQLDPNYSEALIGRAVVNLDYAYSIRVVHLLMASLRINLPADDEDINIESLQSALEDCNKAIAADPDYGYGYYVRAMVKEALKQPDYCHDMLKAEQLGDEFATMILKGKNCR